MLKIFVVAAIWQLSAAEGAKKPIVPSCERINKLSQAVKDVILENEVIPDSVRFAFHSCVGGCRGCLNSGQADNRGLEPISEVAEKFYQENGLKAEGISRADLWAMFGVSAASAAIDNIVGNPVEKPCFEFFWGRPDCPTSPATTEVFEFPQPTMNSSQMYDYFQKTFNMDILETVAVLGAHSLGRTTLEHAGFNGVWTPKEETTMYVTYYQNMIAKNLTYKNVDATAKVANASKQHWQWEAEQPDGETSMMLNTDFEIFFNLELDQNGKTVCKLEPNCVQDGSCGKNNLCAKADTYEQGHEYIKNPQTFLNDFKNAYTKMLQTKTSNLVSRGSTCSCSDKV